MRVNKSLITFQQTGAGTGSVTSVAMTVPTGLTISGSPITSSGTLALGFASGVALPPSQTGNAGKYLTTDGTNLSWGNISGTISGTANYVPFFATSSTLGTSPLYYDGSYYMAIGTTTTGTGRFLIYNNLADTHLQVSGTTPSIRITDTPTSATYNSVIGLAISSNSFITNTVAGDLAIDNSTGGSILFGISNSEKFRIFTSTGNVNIGGNGTDTGDKLYVGGVIKGTGQLKLTGYTSTSSFTGTAAGYLAFDSSGNILSAAAPSGTNIYNSDGTLTADRTITNNGFYLRLLNTETIASGSVTRQNFALGNTLTNNGTGVVTGQSIGGGVTLIGTLSNSIVRSTNSLSATRNNASDISSSASSSFQGLAITHNHLPPASASIVTASVLGVQHSVNARTGTMNNVWSFYSSYFISPFGGDSNASVGNFYGLFVTGRVGQASGPTASLTNFYGVYIDTPLLGATGTITNRWGIYAPDSAMNHYINGITSIGTSTINGSAILQLNSTSRGFLPPRMTNAQRTAISSPAVGLIVYCTDAIEGLYVYKSGGWTFII